MEKDPTPDNALSEDELDAISGGASSALPSAEARAQQNQKMLKFYQNQGLNVTLEQVSDAATCMDIGRNRDKYRA